MLNVKRNADFLADFLQRYWFAPPVALWRSIEARALTQIDFPAPLLDFGCGDGMFTELVFGKQPDVYGCDIAKGEMPDARDSGMYWRGVQYGDGHALPYATGQFGSVYSNSVVEHIPDPQNVLPELSRVLRKDGLLVLTVPSDQFRSLLNGVRTAANASDAEAYAKHVDTLFAHHHYHTPDQWRALFAANNMELVHASYYISPDAVAAWDRMNNEYGIGKRSRWNILVSPRLRGLGYQSALKQRTIKKMLTELRPLYEQRDDKHGGGLLVVGKKL
jgi:SAM-dependent methyltransferase